MSAPSFSSFPPSFRSFPDLEKREDKASSDRPRRKGGEHREEHLTKIKHEDRDKRRHKRDRDDRKIKDGHKLKDGKPIRIQRDDEQVRREEDRHPCLSATYDGVKSSLFVIDKVGDPMNVVYGGIHGSHVPKYRRVGFGNVLGLGNALKIVTRGTGGKALEIGINGRRPPARYTDPHFLAILTTVQPRHLITGSLDKKGKDRFDTHLGSQAEFVRLPSRRGRSTEEPLSSYRSIHTSTDQNEIFDSDVSSAPGDDVASSSESDTDSNIPRTAHQHSLAALEAVLQQDPTSLSTWYALLDQTLSTVPPSANSSLARARAEIKLSVIDRAIRTHTNNKASVELRVKWLNAGAEIWDGNRIEKEWEQAVIELGGHTSDKGGKGLRNLMWEEWLRWRIRSAGRGSRKTAGVGGIVSDARRAMDNIEGEMARVKLLWRIAVVLRDAGFSERAMSIFQAQAELSFNCPPNLVSEPLSIRLDVLEEFWDAEHARIGEDNARGWDAWVGEGKPELPFSIPSQQPLLAMDVDTDGDFYSRWAANEAYCDSSINMAKHADEAEEDPYAAVIFSDVRPLLVDIITPEAKHAFRIAWLEFLGLHVPGFVRSLDEYSTGTGHDDDTWSRMHLTRKTYLHQLLTPQMKRKEREWDACAGTIIGREKTYGSTFGCIKEWGLGVFEPLEGITAGEGRLWEDIDVSDIDKECARRVFLQVRHKTIPHQDEEWNVMAVAFEAASSIKSALKLSRTLLSVSRDSLPLWGVHARLEGIRGKQDEARRIYDTALSTSSTASPRRGEAALWWAWAEMEWLTGDDSRARAVILRAAGLDAHAAGAMPILRAKRGLEERMRSHYSALEWKERESWACLRALLEVVTGGTRAAEEGMEILKGYASDYTLEGVPRESAWTRMALLGWKHGTMLGRQVRRVAVRNLVVQVVTEFERVGRGINTAVLGVFLEGEKGESVWGRVKALVGEGGMTKDGEKGLAFKSREKGVARRVWEVWLASWERGGWEGEKERLRNSLGIGIAGDRTCASPILWRIYVELEIYSGELKRAKALLFRAVSECPLVKELYLLAFGPLRSVFTARELEGWAETMAERGIRIHRDLDEYAGKGVREESNNNSSGGEEDEFDRETRDYRRLAPF